MSDLIPDDGFWKCERCGDLHTGRVNLYECKECGAILCQEQVQIAEFGDEEEHVHPYYGFVDNSDELIAHKTWPRGAKTATLGCGPVYLKLRQVQCGSVADANQVLQDEEMQ